MSLYYNNYVKSLFPLPPGAEKNYVDEKNDDDQSAQTVNRYLEYDMKRSVNLTFPLL